MGAWYQPGTHAVPRQGDVPIWSSGPSGTRRPSRACPIHRCCGSARRDIAARPVRPAQTGNSPTGAPWQQTGTHMGPGSKQGPPWVPGKGDVMIRRPCLVAWPVGSDWRTQRPID
jgi:hypothetical protein